MKVIFLMGPTASGKTSLAVNLVERLPLDIINVDSAQVYRQMDIGSGKLDRETLIRAPHRLIDIRDPSEPFSAAEFVTEATREIKQIHEEGRIPILVGGTMLYFKALLEGLDCLPAADEAVRKEIQTIADNSGWAEVHKRLAAVDPEMAAQLHPNDKQRLQRALEVYRLTGRTMTQLRQEQQDESGENRYEFPYETLQLIIAPSDRSQLHSYIAERFESMLVAGLESEVQSLIDRGDLHLDLPSIRAVGYRQMWQYLTQDYSYEEMHSKALAATRQLAKRQLTWLRNWAVGEWLESDRPDLVETAFNRINAFLVN